MTKKRKTKMNEFDNHTCDFHQTKYDRDGFFITFLLFS